MSTAHFTLSTIRLRLHLLRMDDLPFVHDLNSMPETDEYNTLGIPEDIEVTRAIMQESIDACNATPAQRYTFIITLRGDGEPIGMAGIISGKPGYNSAEIWYKIHKRAWGRSYATEAAKALVSFGFMQLKLHRIEAGCAAANIASARVLEKAGMQREGIRRKALPLKSGWADNFMYAILKDSLQAQTGNN